MGRLWDWIVNLKPRKEKILTMDIRVEDPPTPIKIYVNLLLIQISKTNPSTYILKRSEALPTLHSETKNVELPSLEDVLNRLKELCDLKHRDFHETVEGTLNLAIHENDFEKKDYVAYMHFDNKSDECCHIRMIRANKEPLK